MTVKKFQLKDVEKNSRTAKILSGKYPILLDDQLFKYVFKHKKMAKYLLDALSEYLHMDLDFGNIHCETQKVYFPDNIHYVQYITDIYIVTNTGHIIILEAYTKFNKRAYLKSEAYLDKASSNRYEKDEYGNVIYNTDKLVICINIAPLAGKRAIKRYGMLDLDTHEEPFKEISKHKQMILIGVDRDKTINYNEDVKLFRILKLLGQTKMTELEKMAKGGDEFMEEALNYVKKFLSKPSNRHFGSHYDFDIEEAREEGEKAGMKAGIKSNQMSTARKMLDKGMSLELTAELTGLSIKVLERLRK